jgi:hypothetical protein
MLASRGNEGQNHVTMPALDGEHFDERMAELDRAVSDLVAGAEAGPWTRSRPRKWSAGQHVAHVSVTMSITARAFEQGVSHVLDGTIGPEPRRGLLEALWVWLFVKRGVLPRGARTQRKFEPAESPDPDATLDEIRRGVERHRAVGHLLTAAQRDRLWIESPFVSRWHYRLVEMVRAHAVHARHHLVLVREI